MRTMIVTTVAAAALLAGGLSAHRAEAFPLAAPSVAAPAAIVQVHSVCGANGCSKVQTHRIVHHKPGAVAANHL
jgi:hypothetical protein